MQEFDARSFADAYFAIWNRRQVDELTRFVAEDVRYRDVALNLVLEGRPQVQNFMRSLFEKYPDVEWHTVDTVTESHNRFVIQWVTHRTIGRKKNIVEGVSVVRRDNGLIVENTDYRDRSQS